MCSLHGRPTVFTVLVYTHKHTSSNHLHKLTQAPPSHQNRHVWSGGVGCPRVLITSVWSLQAMQTLSLHLFSLCNWTLRPSGSSCCPLPPPSQPSHIYTHPVLSPAHSHMGVSNLSLATLHHSILHISLLTAQAVYLCVQLSCDTHIWSCSSIWLNQKQYPLYDNYCMSAHKKKIIS